MREMYYLLHKIARKSTKMQDENARKLAREWSFDELEESCKRLQSEKDAGVKSSIFVAAMCSIKDAAYQAGKLLTESRNKNA